MAQISRPEYESNGPFRHSQMTECLHRSLIHSLLHILVCVVCAFVTAPIEPLSNLFLQGVDARQTPSKIDLSSDTDSFYPKAGGFVVADAPVLEPCMGRLMYDGRCDPFDRRRFGSDDTLVKQAGVQGMHIAARSVRNQLHPDSRKAGLDALVVKWGRPFDQPKRGFNALQGWLGIRLHTSDPKPIDQAALRKPQLDLLDKRWSFHCGAARYGGQDLFRPSCRS